MDVRGYGPVKDAAIRKMKAEVDHLRAALAEPPVQKMRSHG